MAPREQNTASLQRPNDEPKALTVLLGINASVSIIIFIVIIIGILFAFSQI